ncbi:peptidoglycan DD-metalloendopeptidase family protein [Dyella jejuensis]
MAGCSTVVVQQPPGEPGGSRVAQTGNVVGTYTVAKGDTLYSIAFRNGTDFREVARLNAIAAPYTIWPGQVLKLPGHGQLSRHAPPSSVAKASPSSSPPPPMPSAPVFQPEEATTVAAKAPPQAPAHASSTAAIATAVPASTTAGQPPASATPAPAAAAPAVAPAIASGATRAAGGIKWRWPAAGTVVGRFQSNAAIPGIDIAGKEGDPVVAAADGVVVYSGNGLVGYGELVIIKHNDSFLSAYGHNRKRLVTEGQQVKAGQRIAEMGSSGSSRDELEFQIRKDGSPVDPLDYLPAK